MRYSNDVALFECCCHSVLEFYKGAASECVAQGDVLDRAPNAPWLLLFASSCEGKGNNECKSHAPMGHRSEDEVEFRMQRCHAGQRSAAAARSCLRQNGELLPAIGMGKTFTTTRSSLQGSWLKVHGSWPRKMIVLVPQAAGP